VAQRARGDVDGALASLVRARAVLRPLRGDLDFDRLRARCLSDLGSLHIVRGSYGDARRALVRALGIANRKLGPLEQAIALNGLGMVGKYTRRFRQAARAYQRALGLALGEFGADSAFVATIEHNLGGLLHARGDFRAAEPHARRAVAIRRKVLGPRHPETLADEAALVAVLDGLEQWDEAEPLHRRIVSDLQRVHGRAHAEVGYALANLGAHWQLRGRYAKAAPPLQRAVRIQQATLGLGHPSLGLTLHNLGALELERGRRAGGIALLRRAHRILERALGPRHAHARATSALLEGASKARKHPRNSPRTRA
jgi:tetratricopeptide (TPR) repeat protein